MLFLHESTKSPGYAEDDFEAAFREGWMPTLAENDDARLLWYTNQAHGSGASYQRGHRHRGPRRRRVGGAWRGGSSTATSRTGCASVDEPPP